MAKDNAEGMEGSDVSEDLRAMRQAVLDLGKALRTFGRTRLAELGEEVNEDAHRVADEGRRAMQDAERRIALLEKQAERSVRDHPAAWATGLLGVIGFGLVLGLALRRHD
ncbi:hypothetical protein [Oceaniglobus roseus]|uniref:hypothetical protein n=1 Tax=Oceaniglobus roseus TaxID=1737570 RepID=UPI0013001414|nr:hypothetical protein [Kandeliimicrobium roseum]